MGVNGKRILFIAPKLFGISDRIIDKLQKLGASVDYFDERPGNSFLTKALIRINRNLIAYYINHYHNDIIEKTQNVEYDYIFFIKGESFSEHNLRKLLKLHHKSQSIVYHWDSIHNNPNALNLLNIFDKKYSFDRRDCENFGMNFLPLFYYDEYASIPSSPKLKSYDLIFIGTVHSDRYRIIERLTQNIINKGGNVFTYFYFQGKVMYYKYLLMHKESRKINKTFVHFSSISDEALFELYKHTKAVVDVNHPNQTGLTLRCIEALGASVKLATTNPDIVNYDFYNPQNIIVIDRQNPIIPDSFISSEYEPIPTFIRSKYSITNWLNTIFQ